jgi:protein-S-isoprenylcysteine O-methyltransferase Ste14
VTSKKGTYLAVMAVTAVLFVLYLFIAPSFVKGGERVPPFVYGISFIALVAVAGGLSIWRARVKKKNPLDREEGVVSGQPRNVIKS